MNRKGYMKLITLLVLIVLLALVAAPGTRANDVCRDKADPALDTLKTWGDLYAWYKNYPQCDDGYFWEGLSDFVVVSLAGRWETLPLLKAEITKDNTFQQFILKHIDGTTDANDLAIVIKNAEAKCPSNLRPLCEEIEKKARMELNESPDGRYQAFVTALPGIRSGESMVVIKTKKGKTIFSKSYGSEDGEHGYVVVRAAWTPNSTFFVYSLASSGGHQPWHTPIHYVSVRDSKIRSLDDYIGAVTQPDFELRAPDTIKAIGASWTPGKGLGEESPFEVSLSHLVAQ
jgi:hypothetical protein